MERGVKSKAVDSTACSHDQLPRILFFAREEGSVVEMVEIQVIAGASSLAQLSDKRQHVDLFQEDICDAGVATARGGLCVLDERKGMHVVANVGRWSLLELHVVL